MRSSDLVPARYAQGKISRTKTYLYLKFNLIKVPPTAKAGIGKPIFEKKF